MTERFIYTVLFCLIGIWAVMHLQEATFDYLAEQNLNEGRAKAAWIKAYRGVEIDPSEAMYFDVVVTNTDIKIEELEVFMPTVKK